MTPTNQLETRKKEQEHINYKNHEELMKTLKGKNLGESDTEVRFEFPACGQQPPTGKNATRENR